MTQQYTLTLLEAELAKQADTLVLNENLDRVCFMQSGEASFTDDKFVQRSPIGNGCYASGQMSILAEADQTRIWIWELTKGTIGRSASKHIRVMHSQTIDIVEGQNIMRLDKVDFPPGAAAHTHVHPGPGIRIVLTGRIGIQQGDAQIKWMGPGEPWFEFGPSPVFAPTTEKEPTTFIRCMILPDAWRGKNTIRYVDPADADKPKMQRYYRFVDALIHLPKGAQG